MTKRIEHWSTMVCPDRPYLPPERQDHVHVLGIIDGKQKLTSRVVTTEGNLITTKSGTVYELGEPAPEFVTWCLARNIAINPEQMIKVITR